MSLYSRLSVTTSKLLTKYGQQVTQRKYSANAYNPATGEHTNTLTDTTRKGVLLNFEKGQTTERGTLIQINDKRLLLDNSAEVDINDHFIVNGFEYAVVSVIQESPAGTSIYYDVHLRS
jgi:hypothetical protein